MGFDDAVAELAQDIDGVAADVLVVLEDKYGFFGRSLRIGLMIGRVFRQRCVREAGRRPVQRDSLYNELRRW